MTSKGEGGLIQKALVRENLHDVRRKTNLQHESHCESSGQTQPMPTGKKAEDLTAEAWAELQVVWGHFTNEIGESDYFQARTSSTGLTGTIRATRCITFLFCSDFFRS